MFGLIQYKSNNDYFLGIACTELVIQSLKKKVLLHKKHNELPENYIYKLKKVTHTSNTDSNNIKEVRDKRRTKGRKGEGGEIPTLLSWDSH